MYTYTYYFNLYYNNIASYIHTPLLCKNLYLTYKCVNIRIYKIINKFSKCIFYFYCFTTHGDTINHLYVQVDFLKGTRSDVPENY